MAEESKTTGGAEDIPSKYKPFTSRYTNFNDEEVCITLHFRKPERKELIDLSKADRTKQYDTLNKVLGKLVYPKEKNKKDTELGKEPTLVAAYADAIMKRCGAGSVELGN